MKKAEECTSIEEIRNCIDEIDREIVAHLAKRSLFVKCAAKFKKTTDEVRARERVESMIKSRRGWASNAGISPEFIEFIFRNIVSYFIGNELSEWKKENSAKDDVSIHLATLDDAKTILSLQKRAYVQEVELNDNNFNIPPMLQNIESIQKDFESNIILKATIGDLVVGSVRAKQINTTCYIGRLIVEPIYQKRGIGRVILKSIEDKFPEALEYELFTGIKSVQNREFYKKAGYLEEGEFDSPDGARLIMLRKRSV
jgi:chorismate mutase/GNAT superfamily N-acetyltransferase